MAVIAEPAVQEKELTAEQWFERGFTAIDIDMLDKKPPLVSKLGPQVHWPRKKKDVVTAPGLELAKWRLIQPSLLEQRWHFVSWAHRQRLIERDPEELFICYWCHELLWWNGKNIVHQDGGRIMMLCWKCGHNAAPSLPPRYCPQCGADDGWGDDHSVRLAISFLH